MGSYVNGMYLPALAETGWDDEVNDNFRRLGDVGLNVKAYGAVGDGTTNDAAAITAAVAAAPTGASIVFPGGSTYKTLGNTITGASKLHIAGNGATLKGPGGAGGFPLDFVNCTDILVEGLRIDMNALTQFGGIRITDCQRVTIRDCYIYDSSPQAGSSDFYAIAASTNGGTPNTDIHILGNVIEDLAVEVDHTTRAHITGNTIRRSKMTCAIGCFSTATTSTNSDFVIADNVIVDPNASGAAIVVDIDPVDETGHTFRRFNIHDNDILYTGASTPKAGILVGTANNTVATSGNTFTDISVHHNKITYAGGSFSDTALFFNSSATSEFTFQRCDVSHNQLYGTGAGDGISLRRFDNGSCILNRVTNFSSRVQLTTTTTASYAEMIGTGTPEGVVNAGVGSIFHRTDGGAATTLYAKESGTTETGWVAR